MMKRLSPVAPETTVFVFLAFEGPDRYSLAGSLGTRMAGLTEAFARAEGRATAARYLWPEVITRYAAALECALSDPGPGSG